MYGCHSFIHSEQPFIEIGYLMHREAAPAATRQQVQKLHTCLSEVNALLVEGVEHGKEVALVTQSSSLVGQLGIILQDLLHLGPD